MVMSIEGGGDAMRVTNVRVGRRRRRGGPKHRWKDTIGLKTEGRRIWRSLIEFAVKQKSVSRKD